MRPMGLPGTCAVVELQHAALPTTPEILPDGAVRYANAGKTVIVLPHRREGLRHAWSRGFLTESQDYADYRIGGAFVGWEVPGIFDVEMQAPDFSLRATGSP